MLFAIFVLIAALAIPMYLERLVVTGKLSGGKGRLDGISLRFLRSLGAMFVVCYLMGVVSLGQLDNISIALQLLILSAFIWVPTTIVTWIVGSIGKRSKGREGPDAPPD